MKLFKAMFVKITILLIIITGTVEAESKYHTKQNRLYNSTYTGEYLNRIAFPLGGIGAGMICLEGTGAISHVSVRNKMDASNEPCMFAAICIKGKKGNTAKVLEGQVPGWKILGSPHTGAGDYGGGRTSYGFPRFFETSFLARFPFATVKLGHLDIPLDVEITSWSPFIPGDSDQSSLPVGAIEYRFNNTTDKPVEAVFSYNTTNFMASGSDSSVLPFENGFVLWQQGTKDAPQKEGAFAIFVNDDSTVVDHCWFKGSWWDSRTLVWENIAAARLLDNPPVKGECPGASLYVPLKIEPGQSKTVRLMMAWYVPNTMLSFGAKLDKKSCPEDNKCDVPQFYIPWYAGKFSSITEIANHWRNNYDDLRRKSVLFRDAFYDTTLPPEVVEAVAANLTILKSPTVLRQTNGRLWCFEGCLDKSGCCPGSCTHVWNYAQAICHLFPDLERSLRQTEFNESQDEKGHQTFRASLPVRRTKHDFHSASDGQLGGIMKVYREWRVSGNTAWLKSIWPKVKQSLSYCVETWDPRHKGVLEEPHHNTYDIEYWGPDGHCTSFYLGALVAAIEMGKALDDDVSLYEELLEKGRLFLESKLYNGEYFYQKIQVQGLSAKFEPLSASKNGSGYQDIVEALNKQGPKYQYGTGCLSDGVLGFWIARMCGLGQIVDEEKVRSNVGAIYKHNFKPDLSSHANPQRPSYAYGTEGGLLLCTWPRGGQLSIPFVYSNEVWTGIEYQVASHLMLEGMVDKGLDVVRACRDRYDGRVRNPFNEYECGHWYARAMSSYGMIQGLTGVRYDAVEQTLYIDSKIGNNFKSFLSTATGFGSVGLKNGKPFVDTKTGNIKIKKVFVSGKKMSL